MHGRAGRRGSFLVPHSRAHARAGRAERSRREMVSSYLRFREGSAPAAPGPLLELMLGLPPAMAATRVISSAQPRKRGRSCLGDRSAAHGVADYCTLTIFCLARADRLVMLLAVPRVLKGCSARWASGARDCDTRSLRAARCSCAASTGARPLKHAGGSRATAPAGFSLDEPRESRSSRRTAACAAVTGTLSQQPFSSICLHEIQATAHIIRSDFLCFPCKFKRPWQRSTILSQP